MVSRHSTILSAIPRKTPARSEAERADHAGQACFAAAAAASASAGSAQVRRPHSNPVEGFRIDSVSRSPPDRNSPEI